MWGSRRWIMKWTRISIVCVIGLALSCAGGDEFAGGDGSGAGGGFLDGLVIDGESPDLVPGVIELATIRDIISREQDLPSLIEDLLETLRTW